MTQALRYTIDRVGDVAEWQVFDGRKVGTPVVYHVQAVPIRKGAHNHQLFLTVYDGAHAASTEYAEFEIELFSTSFYAANDEQCQNLMYEFFMVLMDTDIDNPVELAHQFGGQVRNRTILTSTLPFTH
jgi:hypothetical protein